eukprot:3298833-Rhodomonas_salina.2
MIKNNPRANSLDCEKPYTVFERRKLRVFFANRAQAMNAQRLSRAAGRVQEKSMSTESQSLPTVDAC